MMAMNDDIPELSIVLPAWNEADGIAQAIGVIEDAIRAEVASYEIVVVDDGSRDGTFDRLRVLAATMPHLRALRFSRNFGKEAALLAGLEVARGRAVVTMDADLQHPPTVIPDLLRRWRDGARVVHAVKQDRSRDGVFARARAALFNDLLSRLAGIRMHDATDFKLLDRVAVDLMTRELPERRRFYRGLADWVGFRQAEVPFTVAERNAGQGKWSILSLLDLATTAIVSFTSAPLRIVTGLGFLTLLIAVLVGGEALWSWFAGETVSGFATVIGTLLLIGSFVMISLGIVGEYIAKIYEEIKARPVYVIEERIGGGER